MPIINLQPIEKQVLRDDGRIEIVGHPWLTIQGEGPFAGRRAVFIRLAGCDLQCPGCDTDYTSDRHLVDVMALFNEAAALTPAWHRSLVVLTGGEPLRQDIRELCDRLDNNFQDVQIETNGTYYQELPECVTVVCSPKAAKIASGLKPTAYKYVVEAGHVDPHDGLPTRVLGQDIRVARPHDDFTGDIFVQPCDEQDPEKNKANMQQAVASCLQYGYRLGVQIHKIAGLP